MIGAGTGVAPFRGFVQERLRRQELGQEVGQTLLFMGFRHPDMDFIYKDEWTRCTETLGPGSCKIWTAFSRFGAQKVYVQDRLRDNTKEVLDLLNNPAGCRLYICGSAAMAREVVQVLVTARMASVGADEEQAALWIRNLRSSKQLLEDVWG
ncbi:ferredoxin reductase-like protein [Xylariaceae sp. FL0662B]|nr:ferredoxin reductase-like protein [Xylariaceae sp. FL0662B]